MNGIKIRGTGHCVPAKIVTNEDLSRIVDTDDAWIQSRTGIRTRHHCTAETHTSLCTAAAKTAIRRAGIDPGELGACIVATITPDHLTPAAACLLQRDLGLPSNIPCFDLNAACTGFLFALHTMECLLNASPYRYGLVIGCEVLSRLINFEDRSTCVLFGDGAGAVVVESGASYPSIHAELGVRGNDRILVVPGTETGVPSKIEMDGAQVFKFAVETVPLCINKVLEKAGKCVEDVDFFVFHQANLRIMDLAVRNCHIPPEKTYQNIGRYGNTSAASIPIVLSELTERGMVGPGSRVLCVGFGGGLTWGGALVEFA